MFNIAGGRLADALGLLSQQSGISVGMAGRLPDVRTRPVHGRMNVQQALDRMLRGTGLKAVQTGVAAYRLEPQPRATAAPVLAVPPLPQSLPDIIVTGTKRRQELATVPFSMSVLPVASDAGMPPAPASSDIAGSVDGLTVTNAGPGRNRQFIRGVADSPFDGTSQSTVAIQMNDIRVSFNAPDPDLRLVDVERVEILKGPQGPLYGSGALGGVYHIVTRQPDLSHFSASTEIEGMAIQRGGYGGGIYGVANLPISENRFAIRAVGYAETQPGWIDNRDGRKNANDTHIKGGRLTALYQLADDWSAEAMGVMQLINQDDSQYVIQSARSLSRNAAFPEPRDNDFYMGALTIHGRIGGNDFVSATGFTDQRIEAIFDASAAAAAFGLTGTVAYEDKRIYRVFNQELRLSRSPVSGLSWVTGLSIVRAQSIFEGTLYPAAGDAQGAAATDQEVTEVAAFAEGSLPIARHWKLTAGGRLFYSVIRNERTTAVQPALDRRTKISATPSVSLSWAPSDGQFYFIRVASALRPGGLNPVANTGNDRFLSDELVNLDIGWRLRSAHRDLDFSGAIYVSRWNQIQSDYLLDNGLVATHNVGDGRIYGVEASIQWQPGSSWTIKAGTMLQSAILEKVESPQVLAGDAHLPIVPDITARLHVSRAFALADWQGRLGASANFTGPSRLSFDQGLDRRMGEYTVLALGGSLEKRGWRVTARIDNLLNAHGDSFAMGNPFSLRNGPQYTPLRPRMMTIGIARRW